MRNKRGFEFSFAWIFAIIVGAIILFLAIYFAITLVGTEKYRIDTETAKQVTVLLHPLQTSANYEKADTLKTRADTRIYNKCYPKGVYGNMLFGENRISISEKSSLKQEWQEPGGEVASNNYLFSREMIQGQEFHVLVERFNMPFHVADVISMYSEKYCFVGPPAEIENKIRNFQKYNLNISYNFDECPKNSDTVCFSNIAGCDIIVQDACTDVRCDAFDRGYVTKTENKISRTVYYTKGLFFAALFSDTEIYECNVQRLMKRLSQISLLFKEKTAVTARQNCNPGLEAEILSLAGNANSLESSEG